MRLNSLWSLYEGGGREFNRAHTYDTPFYQSIEVLRVSKFGFRLMLKVLIRPPSFEAQLLCMHTPSSRLLKEDLHSSLGCRV